MLVKHKRGRFSVKPLNGLVLGFVSRHIQLEKGLKLVIFCRNDVVLSDWLKEHDFLSCNLQIYSVNMKS